MHNTSTTLPDAHSLLFGFECSTAKEQRPTKRRTTAPTDARHREITAQWSARYKRALGFDYVFSGRDAAALKRFLARSTDSAEDILRTAAQAWAVAKSDRFARACRMAATLHGLCAAYNEIRVELTARRNGQSNGAVMP